MSPEGFSPRVFPRITGPEITREIERARVRGFAAGHAEGVRAASRAAAAQRAEIDAENDAFRRELVAAFEHATSLMDEAAQALIRRHNELLSAAQQHLERLAVDLAEAVIARELDSHNSSARNALHRALAIVDVDGVHSVRMNPRDIDALRQLDVTVSPVPLVADPSVKPGDAYAELDNGAIDARLSAAFVRARTALEEAS